MSQTWTELLEDIKVRAMMPTSQSTFTEARLLRLANAVLRSEIVPIVDRIRDGYWSYDVDTVYNATGVYDIHARAVGAKLIDLSVVDGDEKKGLTLYSESELRNLDAADGDIGCFLKRNQIHLLPKVPSEGSSLRQTFILAPGTIIANDGATQVNTITPGVSTTVVTCDSVPTAWTTADAFDVVQEAPHFDTLSIDLSASAVVTGALGTLTFANADVSDRLVVGDWISLRTVTPVIQVPDIILPLLAQKVANVCLRSLTDQAAYKLGSEDADKMEEKLLAFLDPRVQNEGKKIVNRTGILRRGM